MSGFGEGRWMVGRKDHRCEYCYGPIPQGEELYHYRGMFDGEWQNWRMHRECWEAYSHDPRDIADGFTSGDAEMPERVQSAQIISRHMCPCELAQQRDPECPLHGREVLVVSHRVARTEEALLIEPEFYVVVIDHEANGEVSIWRGNAVENNLIEIVEELPPSEYVALSERIKNPVPTAELRKEECDPQT